MIGVRKLPKGQKPDRLSRRMILFIILGTLPLFLILPVKDYVEGLYQNPIFIGCAFLGTGLILFLSDRLSRGSKTIKNASIVDVLLVGCGQALATVPGISRSGTTISVGLARGFSREFAVKFSFLLSIPAVLGANILSLIDAVQEGIDWTLMPVYWRACRGRRFRLSGHPAAQVHLPEGQLRRLRLLLLGHRPRDLDSPPREVKKELLFHG